MKLAKTYEPGAYEPRIYQLWEQSNSFAPKGDSSKSHFSIALPPPNANGNLHVGHALTIAVEDVMIRYRRLKGEPTVFIPGADHAGFETWVVFEKHLEKEGKSRFDFSRDELYSMVWDFVAQQRGNMEIQLRELGASLDWTSLVFTLDKKVVNRAYKTFKQLWDEGLVYRGERIVNFCTKHQTSFADIEVVHKVEKSKLWTIAYKLADESGEIIVATTRPETMLGDVALAVNPKDKRYAKLVSKHVHLPLSDRTIPIIADDVVDPTFGTGVVKVTPAHDPIDFEIGTRHDLPVIQVVGFDGKITDKAPKQFTGLDVLEARKQVIAALEAEGALKGAEDYSHSVGHCYKCDTVIQPLVKDQWFLKIQPLAQRAIKAIEAGEITFTPASKAKVLVNYFKNLKDWNLSRQIPWGIPIPAFQSSQDPSKWVFDERVNLPTIQIDGIDYHREEDTFDTWFSSGQWPFITTDSLEKGELKNFYPLSVMETGNDILFSWIARMIMLGLFATDTVPFKHVYLHGLVMDEHGQKMSKSKGNVINPQEIVTQYGSDATRMGLIAGRSPGVNQAFSTSSVIAARNFCNKLWNIARFTEDKLGAQPADRTPKPITAADHWVIDRLNKAGEQIGKHIEEYRFAEAYETLYHTIWDDIADWYVECSKDNINESVLSYVLETCLKLAHPFAPFVTETIWQTLDWEKELLITSAWPTPLLVDVEQVKTFEAIKKLVGEVRFITADLAKGKQRLVYETDSLLDTHSELIRRLSGLQTVSRVEKGSGLRLAVSERAVWLDIDTKTLNEHKAKLQTRLDQAEALIAQLEARLQNKSYVTNAPQKIVDQTKSQLQTNQELAMQLRREITSFS